MILDAEVLLIDTQTSKPLPFGTLGIHKVPSCSLLLKSPPSVFSSFLTDQLSLPVPPESSLSGRQRVPFCIRLYLLQWHKSHGEVSARETAPPINKPAKLNPSQQFLLFNHINSVYFRRPLCERRKFLHDNMVVVPNRILFSEMKHVTVRHGNAAILTLGCMNIT